MGRENFASKWKFSIDFLQTLAPLFSLVDPSTYYEFVKVQRGKDQFLQSNCLKLLAILCKLLTDGWMESIAREEKENGIRRYN